MRVVPISTSTARVATGHWEGELEDDDEEEGRAARRMYLREILIGHPLWKESRFWEGALWQLVLEQLQTIPNSDVPWHDVDVMERDLAVQRVHAVIFSQVMAIIHSMLELGCTKARTKELVYRMSVIHQLTESQRHSLIRHIIDMKELVFTDLDAESEGKTAEMDAIAGEQNDLDAINVENDAVAD